jgi:hypothetical protein
MASDRGEQRGVVGDASRSAGLDPVAALALLCGVAGIFLIQIVLVPVTLLLAAVAGGRARSGHGDIGYAYTAFGIGAVDGILLLLSLVLHGAAPPPVPH